jgi:ABC-type transporter Mla subunit MlaD
MNSRKSPFQFLRVVAALLFLGGVGLWLKSGARLGWTQTSVVTMQRDEITGIDFPVREKAFIAGVEVPLIATAAAASTLALAWLATHRKSAR